MVTKVMGRALARPPLHKAILEPKEIKSKRRKPKHGGAICLEQK